MMGRVTLLFVHHSANLGMARQQAMAFLARTAKIQSVYFSYDDAFFVLEIFAIIGLIAALLIKSRKKHKEIAS